MRRWTAGGNVGVLWAVLALVVAMAFSAALMGAAAATSQTTTRPEDPRLERALTKPSTGAATGQGYPVLLDDAATTVRDQPVPILVAQNDTDPDPAGLHVVGPPPPPKNGTATAHPDPDKDKATIVYTPNRGFVGTDTFQYDYCPDVNVAGQPACPAATVTVTVKPIPDLVDDAATTVRDQPVPIDVMRNDRNPDVASLQVSKPPRPGAKAEKQPDGTIRYTPEPGFVGEDSFQYDYCGAVIGVAKRAACPSATVTVTVTDTPIISSVQPGSTFAGMSVEVGGNTGSCNRAGTLTFHGMTGDVSVNVTADQDGNFVARVTIPKGAFPRAYKLELTVDCNGQLQRAQGELTVINLAPVAVDDAASTTQDSPVEIAVTANDRNPDPDTGYPTRVLESSPPTHGTTEVRSDQTIVYTPDKAFVGKDRFQYSFCDDVVNAAEGADCGTATVTVTVMDATACLPSPGNTPSIKVDPGKGAGGATLRITATVDRKLAACPFRLLLGGTPLPPDVRVGSDGNISAERGVPNNAKPGPRPIRLATMSDQTLAQTPFQVVSPGLSLLLKLVLGAGALLAGALARAAIRRWRTSHEPDLPPEDVRAEPHTSPVDVTVEPEHDNTRTYTVRLEPHRDAGTQTVQEMTQ
jgi:hypothetical protein